MQTKDNIEYHLAAIFRIRMEHYQVSERTVRLHMNKYILPMLRKPRKLDRYIVAELRYSEPLTFCVVCIYLNNPPFNKFAEICPNAEVVILSDFNDHHNSWPKYLTLTDSAGKRAEAFAITYAVIS